MTENKTSVVAITVIVDSTNVDSLEFKHRLQQDIVEFTYRYKDEEFLCQRSFDGNWYATSNNIESVLKVESEIGVSSGTLIELAEKLITYQKGIVEELAK